MNGSSGQQASADSAMSAPDPVRRALDRRINTARQPSRVINELYAAHQRCAEQARILGRLLGRSPRIGSMVRKALRKTFGVNPDTLLLNVPFPARETRSLVALTLELLAQRSGSSSGNVSDPTAIDAPAREALWRAVGPGLLARLAAAGDYWKALADDSWRSREERWNEVYAQFFADRALLARGLGQLSDPGLDMVLSIVDAPSAQMRARAGGNWVRLQVAPLVWPGPVEVPVHGALRIAYSDHERWGRQVIFLPGLPQVFHEFASLEQLQTQLPVLIESQRERIWPSLALRQRHHLSMGAVLGCRPFALQQSAPLSGDALAYSAKAVRLNQWDNEWAGALNINGALVFACGSLSSQGISAVDRLFYLEQGRGQLLQTEAVAVALTELRAWDHRRREAEISFASLASGLPGALCEAKVGQQQRALLGLLDERYLRNDSVAFSAWLKLHEQWRDSAAALLALLQDQGMGITDYEFWKHKPDGETSRGALLLRSRRAALNDEARLQRQLGILTEADLQRVLHATAVPPSAELSSGSTRVLSLAITRPGQPQLRLLAAFVITRANALVDHAGKHSALLYVPGRQGGLQVFASLEQLSNGLDASFRAPDGSPLWQSISRLERQQARTLVDGLMPGERLQVIYEAVQGSVLSQGLNQQIRDARQVDVLAAKGALTLSDVSDPERARHWLAEQAAQGFQVPASDVREQALANVQLLRAGAAQADQVPAWLAGTTPTLRKQYARLQRLDHAHHQQLETGLLHLLPEVEDFARQRLIAQLRADGFYPGLDIHQPLLQMPDDVRKHWVGHPQRPAGDSGEQTVVSETSTTFSLLQLALYNLDAEAPWTRWRLNRARYLNQAWQARLNPDYLLKTIAALDLGGSYERQVMQAFYATPSRTHLQRLLQRSLRQRAQLDLFDASQQHLGERAQSLFNTLVTAQAVADADKGGHRPQLYLVRLEGVTLAHPRHIGGILVMVDQVDGRCVVYWPGLAGLPAVSEYPDLAQARQALMSIAGAPQRRGELAKKVAPGWESEVLQRFGASALRARPSTQNGEGFTAGFFPGHAMASIWGLGHKISRWFKQARNLASKVLAEIEEEISEQIQAAPDAWLGLTPVVDQLALDLLAHGRILDILRQSRAQSNSAQELKAYRAWRVEEQRDLRVRGLLSFIPGVSLFVRAYEIALAARRVHHRAGAAEVLELVFSIHGLLLEMALTFFPGPGARLASRPAHHLAVTSLRQGLRRLHRQAPTTYKGTLAKPVSSQLNPRKGMKVLGENTADAAIPLHGPVNAGSYAKGGAQFIFEDHQPVPIYRRAGESRLRLKNLGKPGEDEFILSIEEPRQWLLGADAPQPGPSHGPYRPWDLPRPRQAWAPPSRPAMPRVLQQAPLISSDWQEWGHVLPATQSQLRSQARRLYSVQGSRGYDALKLGERYYEVLPGGDNAPSDLVFVTRNRALARNAHEDVAHWLAGERRDQPVPFTFDAEHRWTPRQPLFDRPLEASVDAAFPGMTPASRLYASRRLVELTDSSRWVTSTRLLNIRATLDQWLPPAPGAPGQTDDLLRMLRPISRRAKTNLYIGYDGITPGFERMDFHVPFALEPSLFVSSRHLQTTPRARAVQQSLRYILERQGFTVDAIPKGSSAGLFNFVCTHPNSNTVYFVLTRWTSSASLNMQSSGALQLSDAWMLKGFRSHWTQPVARQAMIESALEQKRLVKIIAGIQHREGLREATVFMVKVDEV
jgi:hypothetical protein